MGSGWATALLGVLYLRLATNDEWRLVVDTTFKLLRSAGACEGRYRHLAKSLGGVRAYGEDTLIPIAVILRHNGAEDAAWALRAVVPECEVESERVSRQLMIKICRGLPVNDSRVLWDLLEDERSKTAVEVAERHLAGEATEEELAAAEDAARDAAEAAASDAAYLAARTAAWAAAGTAAEAAARDGARGWIGELMQQMLEQEGEGYDY